MDFFLKIQQPPTNSSMAISNWLCTNNSKNSLVKIVHPGGHVELHDRPILASEIMLRNPRSCVTHPNIFKQPSAIVSPETTLNLGEKFYVVPISTIRKLQRMSARKLQSPIHRTRNENGSGRISRAWFMNKRNLNIPCLCWKDSEDRRDCEANCEEDDQRGENSRKRGRDLKGKLGSPKRRLWMNYWQPNLQSINEEIHEHHDCA